MTKTVKLTDHYINKVLPELKKQGLSFSSGKDFQHIVIPDLNEGEHYKDEDVCNDCHNVPIYNCCQCINQIRTETFGFYSCNIGETIEIPESVLNNLIGIVEEVV